MTWLDIVLIVVLIIFLAVGARLGSLWTGACVMGGFLGAFLADTYAYSLAGFVGDFPGAAVAAAVLLFVAGTAVVLLPGWLLSRASSFLFLGVLDSAAGFLTGALTGLVAISLVLLFLLPMAPKIEKTSAWKKSVIVKNWHGFLEGLFNKPQFRPSSIGKELKNKTIKKMKNATRDFVDDLTP